MRSLQLSVAGYHEHHQPARRKIEDERFLVGRANYVDDSKFPNLAYLGIVRSTSPHARIVSIDFSEAKKNPDFLASLTGEDLAKLGLNPLTEFPIGKQTKRQQLARGRVRYVGEPVAAILSKRRYSVEDLIEAVQVEYEPLPAVVSLEESENRKAVIYEEIEDNLLFRQRFSKGDAASALQKAVHSIRARVGIKRQAGAPIEPRCYLASYNEESESFHVIATSQSAQRTRSYLSNELRIPPEKIEVEVNDVGGAFGTKGAQSYSEPALCCIFAKQTGHSVKWTATRSEETVEAAHGRDEYCEIELACDNQGKLTALRATIVGDEGVGGALKRAPILSASLLPGPYRIPNFEIEAKAYVTNKTPIGPIRGAGRPEAAFFMEIAIDKLASSIGSDPVEFRRKNILQPDDFPHDAGTGLIFDSANYPLLLDTLVKSSGYEALLTWKDGFDQSSRFVPGIGICIEIEDTGAQLSESARIVATRDRITIFTGSSPHGQGHETTLAQLCSKELSVPLDKISVVWGKTSEIQIGVGTFGSRSAATGGSAVVEASRKLKEEILTRAAKITGISRSEIDLADGVIIKTGGDGHLLQILSPLFKLIETIGEPLEASTEYKLQSLTFASGAHLCALLLDKETGKASIIKYVAVDDCGVVINPQIVEGQVHGGVIHGIGGSLLEEIVYDDEGQPLTTNFLDYTIPTSLDSPDIQVEHVETPSKVSLNGAKGVGESGTIAAYPAVFNALNDALRHIHPDCEVAFAPASPSMIYEAIRKQKVG